MILAMIAELTERGPIAQHEPAILRCHRVLADQPVLAETLLESTLAAGASTGSPV
jgi:hypothetical protein